MLIERPFSFPSRASDLPLPGLGIGQNILLFSLFFSIWKPKRDGRKKLAPCPFLSPDFFFSLEVRRLNDWKYPVGIFIFPAVRAEEEGGTACSRAGASAGWNGASRNLRTTREARWDVIYEVSLASSHGTSGIFFSFCNPFLFGGFLALIVELFFGECAVFYSSGWIFSGSEIDGSGGSD